MSRLKDRICISYLLVLFLNLLQCCIVEMYITSFTLLPLFRTLCLFINHPTLTSYIHRYNFSIFLPWKCSICFCFIACHNSLSFLFYPQPFSLWIWQPFIWSCIPTYDLLLVFPHVLFRFYYRQKFIHSLLFLYPTLTFNVSLHFENTSKRQVNIMLKYD